ncbi:MFS transporter [Pseudomonas sp. dw_358]|uniref:MFS transporter n=1 Tax=Pseudomonas sp. dw_358 TaxID=2720083 RepID=UPI001BD27753|nr:MFS transporter [Pseudomonas sp. dw_358]
MKSQLLALSLGAFAIGVTEFAPMGLLPSIAQGVDASIPATGMLISAYAVGVMIGAPLITLLLSSSRRRSALVGLMALFTLGNLMSAVAPGYYTLLAARLVTSLSHGAFFGLGAIVAASLVPKDKRASAVSIMFMGLTVANIGGVPAATWLGHAIGWRMAFAAISVLGLVAGLALFFSLPRGDTHPRPHVGNELRVLTQPAVVNALLTTAFSAGSMFTLYTYIASVLQHLTQASAGFVTAMLVTIGVGFTLGNAISGRLADRSLKGTLIGFLGMLAVVSFVFPLVATTGTGATIALLLWGAATFGVSAPVQTRVMQEAHDAPALASSVNIGAFNLGNALGAAAGGAALSLGLGYASIAPVGGVLALMALGLVLMSGRHASTQSAPVAG